MTNARMIKAMDRYTLAIFKLVHFEAGFLLLLLQLNFFNSSVHTLVIAIGCLYGSVETCSKLRVALIEYRVLNYW
jgi:hypothetical protein